jgi:hypothetical protein
LQYILDPEVEGSVGTISLPDPKPHTIRRFGRFPSTDLLYPGDLLLFSAVKPELTSRLIASAQMRGGFANEHARWTHAAVYVGRNYVVEAVEKGVQYERLYGYVGGHRLRARRDPDLSVEQRYEIVIQALTRIRERYSYGALPRLMWGSVKGYWNQNPGLENTSAVICSQVYADSYALVTSKLVVPGMSGNVKPCDLSVTPHLNDVKLEWRQVV